MAPKLSKPVVSRKFSCSEIKDAHSKLMEVKKEKLSQEDLQKQIQDLQVLCVVLCGMPLLIFPMIGVADYDLV